MSGAMNGQKPGVSASIHIELMEDGQLFVKADHPSLITIFGMLDMAMLILRERSVAQPKSPLAIPPPGLRVPRTPGQ